MSSLKIIFSQYHHTEPRIRDLRGPKPIGRKWELQVRRSGQPKPTDALRALALSTLIRAERITVFNPSHVKGMVELFQQQKKK